MGTPTDAAMASTISSTALSAVPLDTSPLAARRGWALDGAWTRYGTSSAGRIVVRGEEVDRFELDLRGGDGETHAGFLRVGDRLTPLPAGSRLDPSGGVFTWAPGPGFVGNYDLAFVRLSGGRPIARRDVRMVLHAKGSGRVGAQVVIDAPRSQQDVAQPFVLAGWAADLDAPSDAGIDALHVWAYPLAGGAPVFLGTTTRAARPDVAAIHGEQFRDSGFALAVQGLTPGHYDLAVFPWSTARGDFLPAQVVRLTVR
jgi:hypothetical protein